jgi:hypothetical protein
MPMIQYGRHIGLNPLAGLSEGISKGVQLGSMFGQKGQQSQQSQPLLPDPDVGGVNKEVYFAPERNDSNASVDIMKRSKDLTTEVQKGHYFNITSNEMTSPIYRSYWGTKDRNKFTVEELNDALEGLSNGDDSGLKMIRIKGRSPKGVDSPTVKAIEERLAGYGKKRGAQLLKGIENIESFLDNPKQFAGKEGEFHPSDVRVVQNYNNYLNELSLYPEAMAKYAASKQRKGRAGRQIRFQGISKTTGKTIPDLAYGIDDFMRKHPDIDPESVEFGMTDVEGVFGAKVKEKRWAKEQEKKGKKVKGTMYSITYKGKKYKMKFNGYVDGKETYIDTKGRVRTLD